MHLPALALAAALLAAPAAHATAPADAPISVLFVGNSYTFGRIDPVMSYNTANVRDLTLDMWLANPDASGNRPYEPHPWGGVAGIFQRFTVQAGLNYDVALSSRNAASLRGHLLNTNGAGWDLRSNIGSQAWDQVVLQEQSDEALMRRPGLGSNPEYTQLYVDLTEDWVHQGDALSYRERDFIGGTQEACIATGYSSGACSTVRNLPANASAATEMFLYQTWARPNLVDGAFVTNTDPVTGAVTRTDTPAATFFGSLDEMTAELATAYQAAADGAAADGTGGFTGISPVGQSFLRAVTEGVATRDMWAPGAGSDGLIDLWFDDGTHASKEGSYLSALTLFGTLTGLDPAMFGASELAAAELGIFADDALALQRIASLQLGFTPAIPEPGTALLALLGLAVVARRARKV